jgi:hypothetical protein
MNSELKESLFELYMEGGFELYLEGTRGLKSRELGELYSTTQKLKRRETSSSTASDWSDHCSISDHAFFYKD